VGGKCVIYIGVVSVVSQYNCVYYCDTCQILSTYKEAEGVGGRSSGRSHDTVVYVYMFRC
jgi:hypothetical protein